MTTASLHELKKELRTLDEDKVIEICLRLAKSRKENKELLSYILFNASDEKAYVESVKDEIAGLFLEMPKSNMYYVKKSLRKILKVATKYIRQSGKTETELELLIFYCQKIIESGINIHYYPVLTNLYNAQIKKINKAISKLHEDLQYDYQQELEKILEL